jgi:hypothetical protein
MPVSLIWHIIGTTIRLLLPRYLKQFLLYKSRGLESTLLTRIDGLTFQWSLNHLLWVLRICLGLEVYTSNTVHLTPWTKYTKSSHLLFSAIWHEHNLHYILSTLLSIGPCLPCFCTLFLHTLELRHWSLRSMYDIYFRPTNDFRKNYQEG